MNTAEKIRLLRLIPDYLPVLIRVRDSIEQRTIIEEMRKEHTVVVVINSDIFNEHPDAISCMSRDTDAKCVIYKGITEALPKIKRVIIDKLLKERSYQAIILVNEGDFDSLDSELRARCVII